MNYRPEDDKYNRIQVAHMLGQLTDDEASLKLRETGLTADDADHALNDWHNQLEASYPDYPDQMKTSMPFYSAKELIQCNPVLLSLWEIDLGLEEIETAIGKVRKQMAPYVGPVPVIPNLKELESLKDPMGELIEGTFHDLRMPLLDLYLDWAASLRVIRAVHQGLWLPGYVKDASLETQDKTEDGPNDWICPICGRTIHGYDTCSFCGIGSPWNRSDSDQKRIDDLGPDDDSPF